MNNVEFRHVILFVFVDHDNQDDVSADDEDYDEGDQEEIGEDEDEEDEEDEDEEDDEEVTMSFNRIIICLISELYLPESCLYIFCY